jgi:acyl-CoA reductase-like NAD-dependent aldehyde dehydrogenase
MKQLVERSSNQGMYEKDHSRMIGLAKKGGARVVLGGGRINRPGFYVEATVLTDITKDNPVYTQELFGTVANLLCGGQRR